MFNLIIFIGFGQVCSDRQLCNFIDNFIQWMSQNTNKKEGSEKGTKKVPSKGNLGAPPLSEQQRLMREKELVDALNRQQVHKYLHNIEPNTDSDLVANRVIEDSISQVERQLIFGVVHMPDGPLPLPQPAPVQQKMTYQEQRDLEIKAKRDQIQRKLEYLNDQLRGEREQRGDKSSLNVEVKEFLTKEQHEQKVRQMQSEWSELKKRHEEAQEQAARRLKESQQREQQLKALEHQKQTEKRRAQIVESINKRRSQHEKFIQMEKQLQKKLQAIRGKQRLYLKMQQKYQSEVMLPSLQEKKNKLKQLREFHKNYELDAIKQHEKRYLEMHEKSKEKEKEKITDRKESLQKLPSYQPPARSQRLNRILAQDNIALRRQLDSRKIYNQQRQRRLDIFEKEILVKHKPKVDEQKKQEIAQRYIKEEKKNHKVSYDLKRIGDNYLEIAKKMRRSQSHNETKTAQEQKLLGEQRSKTSSNNLMLSRAKNRSQDFYEDLRRKRIDDIVNSEQNNPKEKFHMLKLQTQLLGEKLKQKQELARLADDDNAQQQAAEILLTSIKAKMGIMNLLRKNGQPQETS